MTGNLARSTRDSCTWSILLGSYFESSNDAAPGWVCGVTPAPSAAPTPHPAIAPTPYNHWRRLITQSLRLVTGFKNARRDVHRFRLAVNRTMPHASSERCDVDLVAMDRIRNHSVPILEIESCNACPVEPTIGGPPGRRFKTGSVEDTRVLRINRDVIDMSVPIQHLLPVPPAILRQENSSAIAVLP